MEPEGDDLGGCREWAAGKPSAGVGSTHRGSGDGRNPRRSIRRELRMPRSAGR